MRGEEMSRVRQELLARPQLEDAHVLIDAVSEERIHLDEIALGPQAAIADQVARVVEGKKILAGRNRLAQRRKSPEELEIERWRRLLDPGELEGRHRVEPGFAHRCAIRVDRPLRAGGQRGSRALEPLQVRVDFSGNLDLHATVARVHRAPHLVGEHVVRAEMAARGIDGNRRVAFRAVVVGDASATAARPVPSRAGPTPRPRSAQRRRDARHGRRTSRFAIAARAHAGGSMSPLPSTND